MAGCATLGFFAWKWLIRLFILWFVVYILSGILGFGSRGYNHGSLRNGNFYRTIGMMKDLQVGLTNFKLEYQRYPVSASKDLVLHSEGKMIQSLLGQEKESNPRAIRFVDIPFARDVK
jgi:hypothetical protein